MIKINWKDIFGIRLFEYSIIFVLFLLLIYSRFVNLGWGLPYPMHPDERNMASAIQSLNCGISNIKYQISNIRECLNPHFFAYGQFPLYLAYGMIWGYKGLLGVLGRLGSAEFRISFVEAVMALRIISAFSSVITAIVIYKTISNFQIPISKQISNIQFPISKTITALIIIFSPGLIQFAHFGTTEFLLMLFYSLVIYYSLLFIQGKIHNSKFIILTSFFSGLAVATKISSVIFIFLPIMVLITNSLRSWSSRILTIKHILLFLGLVLTLASIFSPHDLINYQEFLGSLSYESAVATGNLLVFYTRQFTNSIPILFQFSNIFPYVLGWPVLILFILGFIFLPYKKEINILRFSFIAYFVPNAFLFVKWTRFMAPILPIMVVFVCLFLYEIYIWVICLNSWIISNIKYKIANIYIKYNKHIKLFILFSFLFIILVSILPGIAYLSVYQNPDVRFQASKWIYKNIPNNSYILSETANVIDIPISNIQFPISNKKSIINDQLPNYKIISFNFYDLDRELALQEELKEHLQKADYIFVPSRRIFANHTCISPKSEIRNPKQILNFNFQNTKQNCRYLKQIYPKLNQYYQDLFSGKLGFKQVAEFSVLPDEGAEETWTVFDHPVIRIFKRVKR